RTACCVCRLLAPYSLVTRSAFARYVLPGGANRSIASASTVTTSDNPDSFRSLRSSYFDRWRAAAHAASPTTPLGYNQVSLSKWFVGAGSAPLVSRMWASFDRIPGHEIEKEPVANWPMSGATDEVLLLRPRDSTRVPCSTPW